MVTPNINHKNHVSKTDGSSISVKTLTQMIISLTRLTQLTIDLTRFDISCILDSLLPNMKRFFCSNYHVHVQLFWRFNKNQNYFLSFFLLDNSARKITLRGCVTKMKMFRLFLFKLRMCCTVFFPFSFHLSAHFNQKRPILVRDHSKIT